MDTAIPAQWSGDISAAKALQSKLAYQVSLQDDFPASPRCIAGFDVGFEDDGATTRAAAVLLDTTTLQPLQTVVARLPTAMPYIPGLLSFRELPALLAALQQLSEIPDLVFIDGQGIAHPRRLGIAAHFGVATGLPSVGVAKSILCGRHAELGDEPGARAALIDRGEQIGWALRSKARCNPLIVSPGHRVSLATSAELVMRFVTRYRLPEPTRLADRLASRKGDIPIAAPVADDLFS